MIDETEQNENQLPMSTDNMYAMINKHVDHTLKNFEEIVIPQLCARLTEQLTQVYTQTIQSQLGFNQYGSINLEYGHQHPNSPAGKLVLKAEEVAQQLLPDLLKRIEAVHYTDIQTNKIRAAYQAEMKRIVETEVFDRHAMYTRAKTMVDEILDQKMASSVDAAGRRIHLTL